jgi:hypothetical protein
MPSGHVMFWFAMEYYAETLDDLSKHFRMDPYPLIWFKPSEGILPDRNLSVVLSDALWHDYLINRNGVVAA